MSDASTQPRADTTQQFAARAFGAPDPSVGLTPEANVRGCSCGEADQGAPGHDHDEWAGPDGTRIDLISASHGHIRIELEDIGEADLSDEADAPVLWLRVIHIESGEEDGDEEFIDGASSGTGIPVNVDKDAVRAWLLKSAEELDTSGGTIDELSAKARVFAKASESVTESDFATAGEQEGWYFDEGGFQRDTDGNLTAAGRAKLRAWATDTDADVVDPEQELFDLYERQIDRDGR